MNTFCTYVKRYLALAVAIGGAVGTRLGIELWDDSERAAMIACSGLALIGAVLGMLGASDLYWSPDGRRKTVARASAGDKSAISAIRKKESHRDKYTMFGWAFVFAGAGGLVAWYVFHG